jgi:hypothetical protein
MRLAACAARRAERAGTPQSKHALSSRQPRSPALIALVIMHGIFWALTHESCGRVIMANVRRTLHEITETTRAAHGKDGS